MGKYLTKRILFSIFSLLVVVMVVMMLVYNLINRSVIFQTDDTWNKKNGNDRTYYEYMQYQRFGYLKFANYNDFAANKFKELLGEDQYSKSSEFTSARNAIKKPKTYLEDETVKDFIAYYENEGYEIIYLAPETYANGKLKPGSTPYLIAVKENGPLVRLWEYIKGFVSFESTSDVDDPALTDEMRGIKVENDPYGWFAITGSGTTHKYLLYFDGHFPFIHQNWMHINLGVSFTKYRGQEISTVITLPSGEIKSYSQQYPNFVGTDRYDDTAIDFHSLTYNPVTSLADKELFPDNYTSYTYHREGLSMLEMSFVVGLIAVLIAYVVGLPLGILLAKRKDKLADKIGSFYIVFIMAVPSLAYIFIFAALGTKLFDLPYKYANDKIAAVGLILPTISLALKDIGALMKWMRRYMIDQMNSDYVKFARASGLSEGEIYRKHISKNALIFLVHGIPASILGCLVGAIITESVYAVPGVGNLLTNAINGHDNGVIIACTVFYTSISIISVILGDLLLAKYDPRISLSSDKGGGR